MPLPQLKSHELLLGAVAMMHRARRAEFDNALQWIDHLQQRHPRASQPHAWRAKWHVLRVVQGWSEDPQRDGTLALQAGRQAADSDSSSSLALAMQGLVQVYLRQDFDAALRCYDDALQLNPNEALALLLRGTMHAFAGDGATAYDQTQQALRLSPLDPLRYFYLSLAASAAITAGHHAEAIELAQASLKFNRVHMSTYRALAIAQQLAGRHEDAALTVRQLLHHEPGFTVGRFVARFPGRERAPDFTRLLADALAGAGLPA
jgi:tetratricopeptide (TPR) repeat protein